MFNVKINVKWLVLVISIFALVGCSSSTSPEATVSTEIPLANDALTTVNQIASQDDWQPIDASPSPDGQVVYFTVQGNGIGLYKTASSGGQPELLVDGSVLSPLGLAVSSDGQTVYVTDPKTGIYQVPTAGGSATLLAGTESLIPNVPEINNEGGQDQLYFSGQASSGKPAIWKMPVSGGAPTVLFEGAPLVAPSGVAIAKDGTVYIVDRGAGNGLGSVLRLKGSTMEVIASNLRTDKDIAGITLTLDESAVLVSHLSAVDGTAQVLIINTATLGQALFNKGIAANHGAGGLHRAHGTGQLAWADYRRGGGVYFLEP